MVVTITYGGSGFLPAPLLDWSTEMVRDSRGSGIALRNTLSFNGTILETAPGGTNIDNIITRRQQFIDALQTDNGELQILQDGSGMVSGVYPTVVDFNLEAGIWFNKANYTFTLAYEEAVGTDNVSDYSETWSYQEDENRETITLNHNVSAVGIDTSTTGNNALDNAVTFVNTRIGSGNQPPTHPVFVQASGTTVAYEGLRTEDVDVAAGSFTIAEIFTLASGNYVHTQTASMDVSEGVTTVSLQGDIQGLGRSTTAFTNALNGWDTQIKDSLPGTASGVYTQLGATATLFTSNTTTQTTSKDEFSGSLSYNYSYTDDEQENLPSGIETFEINFSDTQPTVVFSSFSIFGRTLGNIIQNIGTPTEGQISIAGSAKAEAGFLFTDLIDYCETRIDALRPDSANYVTLRLSNQNVNRDEAANEIQFNLQWGYTKSLSVAKVNGPADLSS